MAIKTITPRLPRLGVIRLGTKAVSKKTGKEYPVNSEYFIFPGPDDEGHELIAGKFDEKTDVLRINFPLDDIEWALSDFYRRYTASGLQCRGDGETGNEVRFEKRRDTKGREYDHKELIEIPCASRGCPWAIEGACRPTAILSFCIPEAPGLGVWQMTTHSITAIQQFRAVLELAKITFGRITNLPFELYRYPLEVNPDGNKKTVTAVGLRLSPALSQNLLQAGEPTYAVAALTASPSVVDDAEGIDDPNTTARSAAGQPSPEAASTANPGGDAAAAATATATAATAQPSEPKDLRKEAIGRLWAIARDHGKALGLDKQQIEDAVHQLCKEKGGKPTTGVLKTPDAIHALADSFNTDGGKELLAAHQRFTGNQVVEPEVVAEVPAGAASATDDSDIPNFDDPIPGANTDPATGVVQAPIVHQDLWLAACEAMPDMTDDARIATLDKIARARLRVAKANLATENGARNLARQLREDTEATLALALDADATTQTPVTK